MQYRDTVSHAYLSVQMIQHTRSNKHINRQEVKFVKMSGGLAKNNYASNEHFFPWISANSLDPPSYSSLFLYTNIVLQWYKFGGPSRNFNWL